MSLYSMVACLFEGSCETCSKNARLARSKPLRACRDNLMVQSGMPSAQAEYLLLCMGHEVGVWWTLYGMHNAHCPRLSWQ
jgi:hypothetical protein